MTPRVLRFRLLHSLQRALHTDPASVAQTEVLQVISERVMIHILDLAMRVGEAMLAVGASAHETTRAVTRIAQSYGLGTVHVNVTYDSVTVSYYRGDDGWPTTLMRVVKFTAPDYAKLQRLQRLLAQVESGLELDEARREFRTIRRTPFMYRPIVVRLSQALLAMGVSIMFGAGPMIMVLTFVAALCAALTQAGLAKTGLPIFFNQIAGGFAVTAVAVCVSAIGDAGFPPFQDLRISIIVASGIMLMLAGMAVVGAAQDAIDGFALTAGGRILDLVMRTLGVVLGILFGLQIGRSLGYVIPLPNTEQSFGSIPFQLLGACIVAVAAAAMNGAGSRALIISGLLSITAMAGYALATHLSLGIPLASGIGALIASFIGVFLARRLHVPSVAVTNAAIIPLVPGAMVFRGLLALVHADDTAISFNQGGGAMILAAIIGIALATGASLGLYLGTPMRYTTAGVRQSRVGIRP